MTDIAVGIDVSKQQADVKLKTPDGAETSFSVDNSQAGHNRLIARLQRHRRPVRVCLEATGVYGLDLALALHFATNISVMIINPRRARRFAEALGLRAKTDPIDAHCLLQFCIRMSFEPWKPPPKHAFELRTLTRRMVTVIDLQTQEKNRLHAANATNELRAIRLDVARSIKFLEKSIERLEKSAVKLINKHPTLAEDFRLLCTAPGIAQRSAVKLLGEIATMPDDLVAAQTTAFVGLDPRIVTSGSSVNAKPRISKRGNAYLRAALYMPAHNAIKLDPAFKAFYERLIANGKTKMQAKVAVMRKLLIVIQAMRRDRTCFNSEMLRPAA